MFHQYPYHSSPYAAYRHPQVDFLGSTRRTDPSTLRDRYLAAAAEAKLAEVQYFAAEAASQRLHDPYGPTAYAAPYPDHPRVPYLGYGEESARLQAALDAQLAQAARAMAQEQELLRQKEQLLAALALKQRLDKEAEEQRLAALREEERRRALAEFIPRRLAKNHSRCVCPGHYEFKRHPHLEYHHQVHHARQALPSDDLGSFIGPSPQSSSGSFDPSELLTALLNAHAPDASRRLAPATSATAPCAARSGQPEFSAPATFNGVPFLDLLTQLIDNATNSSASELPKPAPTPSTLPVERPAADAQHREVQSLPDLLSLLFQKPAAPATQAKPDLEPKVDDKQRPQVQNLLELLNHLFQPAQPSAQTQFYAAAPSSPSKNEASNLPAGHPVNKPAVEPKAGRSERTQVESLPDLFNLLFQKPAQPSVQAQFYAAGPSSPPTNTNKAEQTKEQPRTQTPLRDATLKPTTESLKEQLEARLNNEYATEVKDTIQALLASLSDSGPRHGKGKGKEVASEATQVPTVSDVAKSIQTVHSIETAFSSLESEFVFPAQLDFTPPSSPSTLVSPLPGTENATVSDSAIHHLAFTARNQPLRFYEHALGELLSQLDRIDSFGNEELRARRKEVVGRVERALEELEREVDARWQIRQKKLAKEQKQVTEVASAPTQEEHPADAVEPTTATTEDSQTETPSLVVVPPSSPSSQPANTPDDNSLLPPVELDVKQVSDVPAQDIIPSILSQVDERVAESQELPAPSPSEAPLSPEPAPVVEIETIEDIAPPSATPTADSSIATTKPAHEEEEKVVPIDTFLLTAQPASPTTSKTQSVIDVDSASEWSEVEA